MTSKFFKLLRFSIDPSQPVPDDIKASDWPVLFRIAKEQNIQGIIFHGMNRLPENCLPDRQFRMKWFAISRQIAALNTKVNVNAVKVSDIFRQKGLRTCILKGQGNALLYPDPLMRTPGDIDIWAEGGYKKVMKTVGKMAEGHKRCYHHIDFPPYGGTDVELHYRPQFMNNLISNSRLQKYFKKNADAQFANMVQLPDGAGCIAVPTAAFNRIYQMAHISNHFFHEGIGLKQLLDYYFVLRQGFTAEEQKADAQTLRRCGLYKMSTAVMFVMKKVFCLEDKYLIVKADERLGKYLLNEIMLAGNFGFYDKRLDKYRGSQIKKNIQRLVRDARFMMLFPGESLWEPVFRLYHFFWRKTARY